MKLIILGIFFALATTSFAAPFVFENDFDSNENTFAHPEAVVLRCIQKVIIKNIKAENNPTLNQALTASLNDLDKGIAGLENCTGNECIGSLFKISIALSVIRRYLEQLHPNLVQKIEVESEKCKPNSFDDLLISSNFDLFESTFAHPNVHLYRCAEEVIIKNIKAENNSTLNEAVAKRLRGISEAVAWLESCHGSDCTEPTINFHTHFSNLRYYLLINLRQLAEKIDAEIRSCDKSAFGDLAIQSDSGIETYKCAQKVIVTNVKAENNPKLSKALTVPLSHIDSGIAELEKCVGNECREPMFKIGFALAAIRIYLEKYHPQLGQKIDAEMKSCKKSAFDDSLLLSNFDLPESTFAHPNAPVFRCIQKVITKNVKAENNPALNQALVVPLKSLDEGILNLENCNGNDCIGASIMIASSLSEIQRHLQQFPKLADKIDDEVKSCKQSS